MGAEGEIGSGGGVGMTGSVRTAFENEDPEVCLPMQVFVHTPASTLLWFRVCVCVCVC